MNVYNRIPQPDENCQELETEMCINALWFSICIFAYMHKFAYMNKLRNRPVTPNWEHDRAYSISAASVLRVNRLKWSN